MKARLLRLAMDVIDAEGEVGVRVNHLVQEAGVTAPTLYHYFGSRDGLIVEAQAERFIRSLRKDLAMLRQALAAAKTARHTRDAVNSMVDALLGPSRRTVRMARVNILGSTLARPELAARLAAAQDEVYGEFVTAFTPLQQAGLLRTDIHLPTAMYWISGVLTSRFLIEVGSGKADGAIWDGFTRHAILELLLGPAPASRRRQ